MPQDKIHFFLKLNPPRPTFMKDMTGIEKAIMQMHITYWQPYVYNGTVVVLGPVFTDSGGFGMAVVAVDNEDELDGLIRNDPANGLNSYEVYPMRAVYNRY